MNCEQCLDKLPDFLLDELPEHQAIVVQEHLLHCDACMAKYRELKGTGKAMEAVPEYREVAPTKQFTDKVKTAAAMESKQIIETLPPERRERVKRRQAAQLAKLSAGSAVSQRRHASPWSGAVLVILLAGIAVASVILLYPNTAGQNEPRTVGTILRSVGKVEQFYQKAGVSWSEVKEGKIVQTLDTLASQEDGCAQFKLAGDGMLYLGPSSELSFRQPESEKQELLIQLTKGEAGIERASGQAGAGPAKEWLVSTKLGSAQIRHGSRAYVMLNGVEGDSFTVQVAKGSAQVRYSGERTQELEGGQQGTFFADASKEPVLDKPVSSVPSWRVDLLGDEELARYFAAPVKVLKRRPNGLEVELNYSTRAAGSLRDWRPEQSERRLVALSNGGIQVPTEARFLLGAPLDMPLTLEAVVRKETPLEAKFALAVLDGEEGRVSVDLGREALLQVVKGEQRARAAHLGYRKNGQAETETVILNVQSYGAESKAGLETSAGKSKFLNLPKELERPGRVWISALDEGLALQSLTIKGVLPRAWLRERMAEE
ncbi:MAG: zf-HC2 domain-containing protein [Planctomycetota bacterium]|nr:zf-HC2 domain-containing protein [Planctomycetota bacterium]